MHPSDSALTDAPRRFRLYSMLEQSYENLLQLCVSPHSKEAFQPQLILSLS